MSGYFSRLLARGAGSAPSIRALKRPRYAAAAPESVAAPLQRMPAPGAEEPEEGMDRTAAPPESEDERAGAMCLSRQAEEPEEAALAPLPDAPLRRSPDAGNQDDDEGMDRSAALQRRADSSSAPADSGSTVNRQSAGSPDDDESNGMNLSRKLAPLPSRSIQREPAEFREGQAEDDRRPEVLPADQEEEDQPGRVDDPLTPSRLPQADSQANRLPRSLHEAESALAASRSALSDVGPLHRRATSAANQAGAPAGPPLTGQSVAADAPLMPPQSGAAGSLSELTGGVTLVGPVERGPGPADFAAGATARGRARHAPAAVQPAVSGPPGIEIHIGRIEIRAESESAPQIAEVSAPASGEPGGMRSLNEYLERRNGEAR